MTRAAWRLLLVLAVVTTAAQAGAATDPDARHRWAHDHPVLRVALDDQMGTEVRGGPAGSLVTQIMELVARRNDVRLQIVRTPSWEASVQAFDEHRVDVLPSMSDRLLVADVGQRALLSSPFYVGRTVIVARTTAVPQLDMWALKGHTLAFRSGGAYESWLRREHPEIRALPLADIHQVLAAVESGIADAGIGADVTFHPLIRRDYAVSLRVAGNVPEMPVTMRVAVSRDQPQLLAMIEAGVGDLSPRDSADMVDRWLQTAYLRAPTVAQIVSAYRVEIGLGGALLLVLCFALWQMRRAQLASRRGEQQKTLLLAVMSHEVRNAVNAVASSIDMIAREPLAGPHRDLVAMAQSGSRNLLSLLKNSLDYTRDESAGFTPDLAPCDVYAVTRDAMAAHASLIDARGIDAHIETPCGALPWLLVDESRLRQLLDNLVGNAVKFTTRGHVAVTLSHDADQSEDGVRRLLVEVSDTGPGIPDEARAALFRPFAQADRRRDKRLGGTGLGLVICRDIVTNLGGTLELESVEGEGTTVRFALPTSLVPPAATEALPQGSNAGSDESSLGTVLLVEDHAANREVIAVQLQSLGYRAHAVARGQEAIDAYEPGEFVAVLLDGELPDMSGFDVAVALRRKEVTRGIPPVRLVAISAYTGLAHEQRCAASGIDAVLGKPLSLHALRTAMAGEPSIDLLSVFREEAHRDLDSICVALANGDRPRAQRFVHRLQGAAVVCGLLATAAQAEALGALLRAAPPEPEAIDALIATIRADLG